MSGGAAVRAEDGYGRIFQRREIAQRIADGGASSGSANRHRTDDRSRSVPFECIAAKGGVFVAVGIERPLARICVVDRYGDAVRGGEFVHELHIVVEPGRDRLLRIFRAVVRKRHVGPGDGEVALEHRDAVIGNDAFIARRRSWAAQSVCDGVAINGKSPLSFKFAFGEMVAAEQIAGAEEFDISVEGASDSDRVFVAEDHDILPRHDVTAAEVCEGIDRHAHPAERTEDLFARDLHRAGAGNGKLAAVGVEFTGDADASGEHAECAVQREIAVVDMEFSSACDEPAQRSQGSGAGVLAGSGDFGVERQFGEIVVALVQPQPVDFERQVLLGTKRQPNRGVEADRQSGRHAVESARDALQHHPGRAEGDIQAVHPDVHAVDAAVHDADVASERIVDSRQLDVGAGGKRILAGVYFQRHIGKGKFADLEVRDLHLALQRIAEGVALVGDGDVVVARQVDHEFHLFAAARHGSGGLPFHLALDLQFHFTLGPVDGEGNPHAREVEIHAEHLGVDVGEDVGCRGDAVLLHLLEHLGILLGPVLAEKRDLLRYHDQFQVAFVVALVGVLRRDRQIGGGSAVDDEVRTLDFRR